MDQDQADELFAGFGPVRVRRMFGGFGLYADGVMFGLEARGALYLNAGPSNAPVFDAEGCEAFAYEAKGGRRAITSFRRAPERLLDDPDEMAEWARGALEAARENARARPVAKSRRKAAD